MLTKSTYTQAITCLKTLWRDKYQPKPNPQTDKTTQLRQEIGKQVGALAYQLFPNGKKIEFSSKEQMTKQTKRWIEEGVEYVYEATFVFENLLVMVDVLRVTPSGVEIYEVKSSTALKEINLHDVAFQYYVLSQLGYRVQKAFVVHINSRYVREEELEVEKLFTLADVFDKVVSFQDEIPQRVKTIERALADEKNEPTLKEVCFCDSCKEVMGIPEYSVFNIFNRSSKKLMELFEQGVVKIEDIPDDFELTHRQRLKVENWKEQKTDIDHEKIAEFLDGLTYPLYHLDFETFQQAIPQYRGIKPYMQIPFQYSLHIEHKDRALEHREFLAIEGEDPRESLVTQLVKDIPDDVMVLAYNMSFEKRVLRALAKDFKPFATHLMKIHDNMVDLMLPFQKGYYMTPQMRGRYSIKYVLPALVPQMKSAYDDLNLIHNGSEAMSAFSLLPELNEKEREEMREALLEYCKLDTLAMVWVLDGLRGESLE